MEEAGEADVAGPQEAKLKHMKKAIGDLTKECADMQKDDWIQKQTQLLAISTETDRLKTGLNDQRNRKMVLDQKRIRIESHLASHQKDVRELQNAMKHLRFDMDKMNGAIVNNDSKSKDLELANANRMMETEFVNKLKEKEKQCLEVERMVEHIKEDKAQMAQDHSWRPSDRPSSGSGRSPLRRRSHAGSAGPQCGAVRRRRDEEGRKFTAWSCAWSSSSEMQEQMIMEMERAINKRDAIQLKYEPKAKKTKQTQSAVSLKRQVQSLKNNLRLCTQATSDVDQKLSERESELSQLQQSIEQNQEEYARVERAAEQLRAEVQVGQVAKQRNLSALLQLQRSARRDTMSCRPARAPLLRETCARSTRRRSPRRTGLSTSSRRCTTRTRSSRPCGRSFTPGWACSTRAERPRLGPAGRRRRAPGVPRRGSRGGGGRTKGGGGVRPRG
ncbi:unnamed protein product [Prorocentrum cordatum]|uniref:Cilia- and flagella-associated protein 157 n=1 Tax=Prorocentrum cordatum TaxID=2364126 RepID=A0ABN9SXR7_9DINO|nr:unnamed protein product [Polarella glacialis]